uniref:Heparan sulfate 2-O-sulfotransferase pipe-like n=1 Tax=Drosophila rhopaloa TaxID=1041015 RepID=A0A6P4FD96_DRORH
MSSLNVRDLNNTRKAQMELVFFNRVPKVGSQTFMELLRRLSERNNFQFHRDAVQKVETIRLAEDQQQEMAEVISELPEPSVFIKHVCFTNFTKFNLPKPIYLNVVRDPVERVISWFYYVRAPWYFVERKAAFPDLPLPHPAWLKKDFETCVLNGDQEFQPAQTHFLNVVRDPVERVISWFYYVRAPWYFVERKAAFPDLPLPHPAWLKKDFETCVLNGDQECTYTQGVTVEGIGDHRRQSLFFCGHDYECTPFNTLGALERAKFAVEQQYAVVGVLEDLNTTLSVLEKYVPRFFEGVRDIYATSAEYLTKINKNNFKPPVSEHVKDIVRRNFTNEIEFYQFCRQRLHKQYLAAHLPQRIITDSAHLPGLIGN